MADGLRDNSRIRGTVQTLVVIDLALIVGVLLVTGALLMVTKTGAAEAAQDAKSPLLTYVGAGIGGMMLAMAMALPGILDTGMRRRLASEQDSDGLGDTLARAYLMRNIVIVALLEGAAMLNSVFYYIESRPVSLVVVGITLIAMGMQIPSMDRLSQWIGAQQRLMETEPTDRRAA